MHLCGAEIDDFAGSHLSTNHRRTCLLWAWRIIYTCWSFAFELPLIFVLFITIPWTWLHQDAVRFSKVRFLFCFYAIGWWIFSFTCKSKVITVWLIFSVVPYVKIKLAIDNYVWQCHGKQCTPTPGPIRISLCMVWIRVPQQSRLVHSILAAFFDITFLWTLLLYKYC